jgi:outer membrane biosynthesis protein TonB
MFRGMTNRFGVLLRLEDVRWAAAEGVSETVIAAVLLLHEHSVDEIVPELSAAELQQVITLVGRSPRLYAPGMLDALNQRRSLRAPAPPVASPLPKAEASVTPHYPHQRDKRPSPGEKPAE